MHACKRKTKERQSKIGKDRDIKEQTETYSDKQRHLGTGRSFRTGVLCRKKTYRDKHGIFKHIKTDRSLQRFKYNQTLAYKTSNTYTERQKLVETLIEPDRDRPKH
jgi:hypothetical protein